MALPRVARLVLNAGFLFLLLSPSYLQESREMIKKHRTELQVGD